MKQIDFYAGNHQEKIKYDHYKVHYRTYGHFVQFITGEIMVIGHPDPDYRKYYEQFGVQLVASIDKDMPTVYEDAECTQEVKKTWLNESGMTMFAVDYEQGIAAPLYQQSKDTRSPDKKTTSREDIKNFTGDHIRYPSMYWARPKVPPIATGSLQVSTPDRKFASEMAEKATELRAACAAYYKIQRVSDENWKGLSGLGLKKFEFKQEWRDLDVSEIMTALTETPDGLSDWDKRKFERKVPENIWRIAERGLTYQRSHKYLNQLFVKERLETINFTGEQVIKNAESYYNYY